jgi:dTDP-4-dehydrorhamnose 3,5-epimerase
MKVEKAETKGKIFKDLLVITPRVFEDDRGYFLESFNQVAFRAETGLDPTFVQDNESKSGKGVLRGLHFQAPPHEQGKLVRVLQGSVLDVVVDIRKNSETFGMHYKVELSSKNKKQLYVPPGFAHGFLVLEEETIFVYKCTGFYNKQSEKALRWNDPTINIDWGITHPVLSEKDEKSSLLWEELESPF